jgi:hypothetical protein
MTFVLNAALGEVRDFARHRAFGRHSSLPSILPIEKSSMGD